MRRCIVDKCLNTDHTILCHRFPKNRALAIKWQISLNLTDCPLDALIAKFCVCCQHFDATDYKNSATNSLNTTAVPKLHCFNPRPYAAIRTKNVPLETPPTVSANTDQPTVSPVNSTDSIELLNKEEDLAEIDKSITGNNDEMYILQDEDINAEEDIVVSIDGTDFTMLDAASCTTYMDETKKVDPTREPSPCVVESIGETSNHSQEFRSNSTDSDVEVLLSEAVFDSEWSKTNRSAVVFNTSQANTNETTASACTSFQSDRPAKAKDAVNLLDSDIGNLDRVQLIDVIKSQSAKIKQLENKLSTYKSANEKLFGYFEAFRSTVCDVHL